MGTKRGPAASGPDDGDDDREPLGDTIQGVLADVDVDSVEAVREIRGVE